MSLRTSFLRNVACRIFRWHCLHFGGIYAGTVGVVDSRWYRQRTRLEYRRWQNAYCCRCSLLRRVPVPPDDHNASGPSLRLEGVKSCLQDRVT